MGNVIVSFMGDMTYNPHIVLLTSFGSVVKRFDRRLVQGIGSGRSKYAAIIVICIVRKCYGGATLNCFQVVICESFVYLHIKLE